MTRRTGEGSDATAFSLSSRFPPVRQPRCPHRVKVLAEQPPFCYSLALLDREGKVRETKTYFGEAEDVAENFIMTVLNIAETYRPTLSPGAIMKDLTEEQQLEQEMAMKCYLCSGRMEGDDRVRDLDHLTGEFLGMAHNDCNLARKERFSLTCFSHNSGYDSHFLIRALSRFPERITSIDAIPLTTQKFKTVTINRCIKFVDSCAFLPDSLDNLVKTLVKSGSAFPILEQLVTEEKKQLLMEKGVYPYSFATSMKRLHETTHLPARTHFYSDLHMTECEEGEYDRAQQVCSPTPPSTCRRTFSCWLRLSWISTRTFGEASASTCAATIRSPTSASTVSTNWCFLPQFLFYWQTPFFVL